ncbi:MULTISPECIES: EAL domain-containing protein [Geobacter]|uniref:EAL domain-containing protein n=1 Tax=Geobacter TaxID=28231 RepID=UPI0025743934|nr:EAL domain-containing protein [Geobacter sulfurreducens]BEH11049.1 EAL domain-containing protein [Geobacter sulfurreducens subsp. ethanolicus]BET58898.1 EAL domain-containing protein [Geobacter sp. 60473]
MKIRSTLTAGCFIFALLTGLVGYFGGSAITRISGEFDAVTRDGLPAIKTLHDIRHAGVRIVASTSEFALVSMVVRDRSAARQQAEEEKELLEQGTGLYQAAFSTLKDLSERFDPEAQHYVREIDRAGKDLMALSAESVETARRAGAHSAILEAKERFEASERRFLDVVDRALALERRRLAMRQQEVHNAITFALFTLSAASAVALLFAVGGGSLSAILISRPIALLQEGVEQVGQGILDTRIDISSNNEIGRLANAFNRMTTELRTVKDEITTARNYLDNVICSMVDALLVVDINGTVMSVNPALCGLLGYRENELIGRSFSSILADGGHGQSIIAEMAEQGQVPDRELLYRSRQGELIPVVLSGGAMRNQDGEVCGIVCIAHDMRERKRSEEEIRRLAYFDPLTGLPNRALFQDRVSHALAVARREEGPVALLFLDLDRFKDINDTLGHAMGDLLLTSVADRLKAHVRVSDTLARLGDDEFVVILTGARDERGVSIVAQSLLDLLTPPFDLEGKEVFISTSIGIALFPSDGEDGNVLLSRADMALHAAKEAGRNVYRFYSDDMNRSAQDRRGLEDSLRRALANGEFYLDYQPQIDMHTGGVFGVEALLRWNHPEEGLIPPGRFIPAAEEMGFIRRIGEWVLRAACLQCRAWQESGLPPVRVAVNVSGHQFNQPGFIDMVDRVLEETGLDPTLLELELTESTLLEGARDTIMTLIDLKVRGIHLAIDDFGTGYSSLSYLKHFPIDRLKIDRSFVRDIVSDLDDRAIVEAIIAMAHSLGLRVLAEGVEREEELELLRERGCDEVQGYYFGRPMSARDVEARLRAALPVRGTAPLRLIARAEEG